jgi:hypothetical protein
VSILQSARRAGALRLLGRNDRSERQNAMTLLAACASPESLIIAADSGVGAGQVMLQQQKIDYVDGHPIAWWFSGDEALGNEFGEWMHARPWGKIRDWQALKGSAVQRVATINKARIDAATQAGASTDIQNRRFEPIDVLVAGYINDIPQILNVDEDGGSYLLLPYRQTIFIGGARDAAWIVSETLRQVGKWENSEATIRSVMDIAIGCCTKVLRAPTQMVVVTPDGAQRRPTG